MPKKRVSTGIKGLDNLIEGGFPRGSIILYTGEPGTGKTIMALQYLMKNSTKTQRGLIITLEQNKDDLVEQAEQFGWNLSKKIKAKSLDVLKLNTTGEVVNLFSKEVLHEGIGLLDFIENYIKENKISYLVFDSISDLKLNKTTVMYFAKETGSSTMVPYSEFIEQEIFDLILMLKSIPEVTGIVIGAKSEEGSLTSDNVTPFCVDGVILMELIATGGEEPRSLTVKKMRKTKINSDLYSFKFTKTGIILNI